MKKIILVVGATGNLGFRIIKALVNKDAEIRATIRAGSAPEKLKTLEDLGVKVYKINNWTVSELKTACLDVTCLISALAGLREVVIDAQKVVLNAALAAGVPRFIPSDYSLDFTKFSNGNNRNLDLRREFHTFLDGTAIAATSIFNGAFTDMLTKEMPMIFLKQKVVLYWGKSDHKWCFTTLDDTAAFTAKVALDSDSPRYLIIAGDQISPIEVKAVAEELTGQKFRLFRPGGQNLLGLIIKIAKKFSPSENELYPAWQGMQYMHNMIDDRSAIQQLDNDRYHGISWTKVKDVLNKYQNEDKS